MAGERSRALAALVAAAVLAGCGGGDREPQSTIGSDDATLAPDPGAAPAQVPSVETVPRPEQTIAAGRLSPVNDSGVTGSVNVRGIGEATEISMNVTGVAQGTREIRAAIVQGTCEANGADVAPIGPLTVGPGDIFALTDTLAIPPGTVLDGSHALVVRAAEARPGIPALACTPLPRWERDFPPG